MGRHAQGTHRERTGNARLAHHPEQVWCSCKPTEVDLHGVELACCARFGLLSFLPLRTPRPHTHTHGSLSPKQLTGSFSLLPLSFRASHCWVV